MYPLHVVDRDGRLVSELLAQHVPRIGELICLYIDVTDEASWLPGGEGGRRVFDRFDWRVVNICHEFRQTKDVRQQTQSITVVVEAPSGTS